jgi:hypothetical protein
MKPAKTKKSHNKPLPTVPMHERLAWRPQEFGQLIGISRSEVWNQIKSGQIETVSQDGIRVIPRAFAIKNGYISE